MNLPDAAFHLIYTTASPPPKEAAGASLTCGIKFILIKTKPQKQEEERAGGHGSPLVPPDPRSQGTAGVLTLAPALSSAKTPRGHAGAAPSSVLRSAQTLCTRAGFAMAPERAAASPLTSAPCLSRPPGQTPRTPQELV